MKKFIMTCPFQPEGALRPTAYEVSGNSTLQYGETRFPIIPVINAYVNEGDEAQVIIIEADNSNVPHNIGLFEEELSALEKKKNISLKRKMVKTAYSENINTQLKLFSDLVECISDGDMLYICNTFGTKPTPIIENMAAKYAAKAMDNVTVECVVYGQMDHVLHKSILFDITALLYVENAADSLARMKVKDPAEGIRRMLDL